MNFPLSTPSIKALIAALQTPIQKQDKAAQEILKRVQNWEKMLAQLERDDWTWLDGILNRQVSILRTELQSGHAVSYYIANGQFATGFAVVQGLIRAEISNKRKELEKLAEARANQSVVEAEKVSATFAKIPMFEATFNNLAQSAILAEENGSKIEEVLGELQSAKSSGSGLVDEIADLLEEAKVQTTEVVAGVKSSAEAACHGANTKFTSFVSDIEDEKTAAVEAKDAALKAQLTAEEADSAIQKLLAEIGNKSEVAQQQIEVSNQALDAKTKELKEATSLLQKARADLNRQGLADSFANHATKLTNSRRKVDWGFYGTLVIGACYVAVCAWIGEKSEPVQWLQKLSPLGILIWIAYSLASRSNVLSRLIEDYEFKAATALAFQGYRLEMDSQPELLSKLLDKAIGNFGSNPTRLMPQAKGHHAHPVEGVIEKGTTFVKEAVDSVKALKG